MSDAPAKGAWAVELNGLAKSFGTCQANRDVTFQVRRGSVHALVGENGAGKSTAMKMLYGMIRPDTGTIKVADKVVQWRSPKEAIKAGIGMVHQHFMLAGPESGLDNILLGAEPEPSWSKMLPGPFRWIDRDAARSKIEALAKTFRLAVDLDRPIELLPVGVQQRLEILKLLYRDVDVLILDEPTAVLTPQETAELFANLDRLKAEGKTILIITHKLDEVLRFADRATVLRGGTVVDTVEMQGMTAGALAELMIGRAVELTAKAPPAPVLGDVALEVTDVTVPGRAGKPKLRGVSLTVRGGEILGVAGVEGNGQSELLALINRPNSYFAGRHLASGGLKVLGQDARRLGARAVRNLGVGFIAEDRHAEALILDFDLAENFLLGHERTAAYCNKGLVRRGALDATVKRAMDEFDVRPGDPKTKARALSGGNQQKLVIAREMMRAPKLLVAAQPTRGVDVGSIEFIHKRLLEARAGGSGVLLVSSSLDEIRALADRIVVFFDGEVIAEFRRGEADEAALGKAMGGARRG